MTEFRKGDKVRVSYETTVMDVRPYAGDVLIGHPMGWGDYYLPPDHVELIEHADNLSADPVGTVRVHPEDSLAQRQSRRVIKNGEGEWLMLSGLYTQHHSMGVNPTGWPRQPLAEVAQTFGHAGPMTDLFTVARIKNGTGNGKADVQEGAEKRDRLDACDGDGLPLPKPGR